MTHNTQCLSVVSIPCSDHGQINDYLIEKTFLTKKLKGQVLESVRRILDFDLQCLNQQTLPLHHPETGKKITKIRREHYKAKNTKITE